MSNVDWRKAVPQTSSSKGGGGVWIVIAAGAAAIMLAICIVVYSNHSAKLARLELEAQEARKLEQDREQREREARRIAEQEEYERELRRKRLEREEEELRLLAKKKKRKRDEAVREADNGGNAADDYRAAIALFNVSARFSSELPKNAQKDAFFCIFASYRNDRLIYKVERQGKSMKATAFSPTAAPAELDTPSFMERMRKEPFAAAIDGGVWIYRITTPAGKAFPVPSRGTDFSLYDAVFGEEFGEALAVVGIQPPEKRFVCSLRRAKGSGPVYNLGEIGFDRALERTKIEAAAAKDLARRFSRATDKKRKEIAKTFEKKRKALGKPTYKPKYVLYDNVTIKQEFGVVKVPRTYKFNGVKTLATTKTLEDSRNRWQDLYDKAVAEEKKAAEYEAEYQNKMSAIDEEEKIALSELNRNSVSDEDIDAALSQYELFISVDIAR